MAKQQQLAPISTAAADLGLGDMLSQQVSSETDEERKRRMAMMQQQKLAGPQASLAVTSLLGASAGRAGY